MGLALPADVQRLAEHAARDERDVGGTLGEAAHEVGIPLRAEGHVHSHAVAVAHERILQDSLVRDGYRMRVYVPFGTQWYPYLMRRLAERPANVAFITGSVLREALHVRR